MRDAWYSYRKTQWPTLLGLAAVLLAFCVPLFIGLGESDAGNDEAIYSYAVDRMLETGEWITPQSIPTNGPFLEKPPLKFWMVAGLIRSGLVPHDDFGLRVLDALFGAVAFVYVYLLGRSLGGPLCGFTAVLLLFTLDPLLFEHGLRSNNMEAPLFLCYCGGIYHFARWADADAGDRRRSSRDALAVAVWFVLGFMTKFVAALFLPVVCAVALALRRDAWQLLRERWRDWIVPLLVTTAASLPWFAYQSRQHGRMFWDVIVGAHVYERFTSSLDARHLQPWYFYYREIWTLFSDAGSTWIVAAGLVALLVTATAARKWLPRLLLVWGVLPVLLISGGTSKILHYAYPFLPPLAIGGGYAAALLFRIVDERLGPALVRLPTLLPAGSRLSAVRIARRVLLAAGVLTFAVGVWVLILGPIRWEIGSVRLLKTSSIVVPVLAGTAAVWLAGRQRSALRMWLAIALIAILPATAYPRTFVRTMTVDHPLRALRDCAATMRLSAAAAGPGVYNAASSVTTHAYFYYLHAFGAWTEAERPDMAEVRRRLADRRWQSPVVMGRKAYEVWTLEPAFTDQRPSPADAAAQGADPRREAATPGFSPQDTIVVLLPGAYGNCVSAAVEAGGRQVGDEPSDLTMGRRAPEASPTQ